MLQEYFMPSVKVNAKTVDLVVEGNHIEIDGYRYEKLRSKPRGRMIERQLLSMDQSTQLIIYR